METVLQQVQARIAAEVPAIKYVDEDWGQLDYYGTHPPVQWPCALIDIGGVTWSNKGHLGQLGLAQVKVRIADKKLTNTSAKAPVNQKEAANSIFATLREVYKALHGYTGSKHYTALIRTQNSRIRREDGVRIYEMTFTTEIFDNSAVPVAETAPKPQVKIAVNRLHT